jgi:hypothetical protein
MKGDQIKAVVLTALKNSALIGMMFLLTWGYLLVGKTIPDYIWESGIVLMVCSLIAQGIMIVLVVKSNSATKFHLLNFLSILPGLVIMIDGGTRLALTALGSNAWLAIAGTLLACGITIRLVSLEIQEKVKLAENDNKKTGRLSPDEKTWNLSQELHYQPGDNQRKINQRRIWRIISPLLPAVGFAVSRNLASNLIDSFGTYFVFLMTIFLTRVYSNQLGIAIYLNDRSREIGTAIQLWNNSGVGSS